MTLVSTLALLRLFPDGPGPSEPLLAGMEGSFEKQVLHLGVVTRLRLKVAPITHSLEDILSSLKQCLSRGWI